MFKLNKNSLLVLIMAAGLCMTQAQTLKVPALSPSQTIKQAFALSDVTVDYSRPSAKGRVVYGDVVPFGKVWRTGANGSTKFTFGDDVKIEGVELKAGTYALYTIPNKDSWDLMFYKDLNLNGNVNDYKAENEVIRVKVKPNPLPVFVETFTINFADVKSNSVVIELLWENTRVAFNVTEEIDSKIMKNIETALAVDSRPYIQAASYYYEADKDQKKALEWANKAIEQNPKAFWAVALKAKIQLKLNDKKGATESANKVIELAKEAKNDDFVKIAEKIIADAKK
jgi:tetratricopeptide (TPR) repeat protein